MYKLFLLMLIIILNTSVFSQVVIKDEIYLDEIEFSKDETESAGLFMPFYGKVKETIYSVYNLACSKARNELKVDGISYQFGPCWSWDCGPVGTCFCSSNISQLVENIPMGTFIDIKIQKCSNWEGGSIYYWKVLDHYFELYSSTTDYYQYKIFSRYDETSAWIDVGWLEFWKTSPPPCNESTSCCSDLPFCETFNLPNATYLEKSAGYEACLEEDDCMEINPCSSSNSSCITNGGMAAIDFAPFHLVDGYEWDLQPCTNPLNNKVRFNYSMMNNGSPVDQIPVVYVIEWCPNNCIPPKTWIEDEEDLIEKLSANPEQMCTILRDICNHFGQYPIAAKYLFREIHRMHEENHLLEFSGSMALKKFTLLDQRIRNVETECSTYAPNPTGAKRDAEEEFSNILSQYMYEAEKDYKNYTDEERTQSQPNILLKVIEYYLVAYSWIKNQGGFTCPEDICEDIKQFIIK